MRTTIPERRRSNGACRRVWLLLVTVCIPALVAACAGEPSGRSLDQQPKRSPWIQVTDSADWAPRRYAATVAFNGQLWLIGGSFLGGHRTSAVWSSPDGNVWTQVSPAAPWAPRSSLGVAVHHGRLWVLGGYGQGFDGKYFNDVWSSSDGIEWTRVTDAAAWSPRRYFPVVSYEGRLWVFGGYNGSGELNDIWSSEDGRDWTPVLDSAPWKRRAGHEAVVHDGRIFLLGGSEDSDGEVKTFDDVWSTSNGMHWTEVVSHAPWPARRSHTVVDWSGRLWLMGGRLGGRTDHFLNDIWSSRDGVSWTLETGTAQWQARRGHTAAALQDRLWILGGAGEHPFNDVWSWAPERPGTGEHH
jgi:leucine-zipper-like transcriptional regulator 1